MILILNIVFNAVAKNHFISKKFNKKSYMLSISNLCFLYLLLKNLKSTEIFIIYIRQKYNTDKYDKYL